MNGFAQIQVMIATLLLDQNISIGRLYKTLVVFRLSPLPVWFAVLLSTKSLHATIAQLKFQ